MSVQSRKRGRQGILPFVIELGEREDVTARAGLPLVAETMRALGVDALAQAALPAPRRRRGFTPAQKLEALVTLIAAGGDRVEDIRILSEDQGLERLLGGALPSPDALLDFLGQFHDPDCWADRPPEKKAYVPPESAGLRALETINRELVARGAARTTTRATIDHDGTIIAAHKRDALMAYEGTRGYQPLVAVWAEEELIVADEFRDGNVAGGEDPLSSAKRAMDNLPPWVRERYLRGDSASYYTRLLKYLVAEGIGFTISADMTKELRACCLAVPRAGWVELENRGSEQVDVAELEFTPGNWLKDALPLRYVAGVMPSGRFGVNAAWFRINALTFNVLTVLKRRALPERLHDARPKRLRFELFTLPGKLTVHQRRLSVRTSAREERLREVIEARGRLLAMRQALRAG